MWTSKAATSYILPGNGHLQPYCREILHGLRNARNHATGLRTMGVTSSLGGEGVSTLAANLAIAAAENGTGKVLLVDTHLARPILHAVFGLPRSPGLVDLLRERPPVDLAHPVTGLPHLWLLTAGKTSNAAHADVDIASLPEHVESLKCAYDCLIFDLPPLEESVVPPTLFSLLEGVLLVTESERVQRRSLWRSKCALEGAGANILGVVVNKQRQYLPRWLDNILPARSQYRPRQPR
jgi:capsular exopolysaccharide synthesis family protein